MNYFSNTDNIQRKLLCLICTHRIEQLIKVAETLSGQPVNIPKNQGFRVTELI